MFAYELDFLPVGNGESSGDAITLRYGPAPLRPDTQTVVVIDAGYTETGAAVVAHLAHRYETDRVDLAISTHPDQDHINGLKVLLEQCEVQQLWMHRPWLHDSDVASSKANGFAGRSGEVAKGLRGAADLEALALNLGVPIVEPFTGQATADGAITVLGPTLDYYTDLLPFDPPATTASAGLLGRALAATATKIREALHLETLSADGGVVSDRNNSSTVLLLALDGTRLLLTGDAGVEALTPVVGQLTLAGITPSGLDLVQMPHHGSRRNVGTVLLDGLLGTYQPDPSRGSAVASASPDAPKHPHPQATNAFLRRGYPVFSTEGRILLSSQNSQRGWTSVAPLPLQTEFEDD